MCGFGWPFYLGRPKADGTATVLGEFVPFVKADMSVAGECVPDAATTYVTEDSLQINMTEGSLTEALVTATKTGMATARV